jgi:hypothetical protein
VPEYPDFASKLSITPAWVAIAVLLATGALRTRKAA